MGHINTLFWPEVESFVTYLKQELTSNSKHDLADNLSIIDKLLGMNKFELESLMSEVMLVSLNDEEVEYIRKNLKQLKSSH